jgi:hypothetical protein
MAEASNTLNGLIQMNDLNLADIDVSDLLEDAPLLQVINAESASNGTQHKYLKQTLAPGVAFRDPNTGIANAASQDTLVTVALKLMDASFERDKGLISEFKDGGDAFMAREAMRSIKTAFSAAEKQLINGTGEDANGNDGLADTLSALANGMVIGAGGVAVGAQTSVYAIRSGRDDVSAIMGNEGQIQMGEMYDTKITTNTTGNVGFGAKRIDILAWMALQMGSVYSAGRLANVDATATLTDDLLSDLIALFPAGKGPTHLVMNRTSLKQLQQSRTATNATGAPAPFPSEAFGIPIIVTDSIVSTEAVLT